ncbi:MAG: RimJ/RimL family protein N-acetyltransferase [Flavobacteriales bacterium]|jgi:RimJ/RimL family protein N-acetyltransferase
MDKLKDYIWKGGYPIVILVLWFFCMLPVILKIKQGRIPLTEATFVTSIMAILIGIGFYFHNRKKINNLFKPFQIMETPYLFTSQRLGFRTWSADDLEQFHELNSDKEVMKHFPTPLSKEETSHFITRLIDHQNKYGHCYFATEIIETGEFIGFIGLAFQTYDSVCTPATDIGWRLKKSAWGKGFATEGAKRCLQFGFEELQLDKIISTCTENNSNSEKVMLKIGMTKMGTFKHPKLAEYPDYENCIWYEKLNA